MNVARVQTESGSRIEPPLDPDWDEHTKLLWKAAVVALDAGLQVTVTDGGYSEWHKGAWHAVPGRYCIRVGTSSNAAYSFREAWCFLTGVSVGARRREGHGPDNYEAKPETRGNSST
ncbi:hypothetical protein [Streptomyces lavendofoliae]|uniref:Uncharacterized protein n=1 Tax=Streptomyces lavendofoliae TaxID=67314 RepID=A0A918I2P9_9ACTN|nr:hypothetical protein [Streptomyces lavendofoliae]GGU62711.1 hypothetical protein GCM10010274_59410 [Streptomyces lavendofoliae]